MNKQSITWSIYAVCVNPMQSQSCFPPLVVKKKGSETNTIVNRINYSFGPLAIAQGHKPIKIIKGFSLEKC